MLIESFCFSSSSTRIVRDNPIQYGESRNIGHTRIQVIVHGILKVCKHHSFSLLSVQYFYPDFDTLQQMLTGFPRATWARMNGDFLSLIVVYDAELPFFQFLCILVLFNVFRYHNFTLSPNRRYSIDFCSMNRFNSWKMISQDILLS